MSPSYANINSMLLSKIFGDFREAETSDHKVGRCRVCGRGEAAAGYTFPLWAGEGAGEEAQLARTLRLRDKARCCLRLELRDDDPAPYTRVCFRCVYNIDRMYKFFTGFTQNEEKYKIEKMPDYPDDSLIINRGNRARRTSDNNRYKRESLDVFNVEGSFNAQSNSGSSQRYVSSTLIGKNNMFIGRKQSLDLFASASQELNILNAEPTNNKPTNQIPELKNNYNSIYGDTIKYRPNLIHSKTKVNKIENEHNFPKSNIILNRSKARRPTGQDNMWMDRHWDVSNCKADFVGAPVKGSISQKTSDISLTLNGKLPQNIQSSRFKSRHRSVDLFDSQSQENISLNEDQCVQLDSVAENFVKDYFDCENQNNLKVKGHKDPHEFAWNNEDEKSLSFSYLPATSYSKQMQYDLNSKKTLQFDNNVCKSNNINQKDHKSYKDAVQVNDQNIIKVKNKQLKLQYIPHKKKICRSEDLFESQSKNVNDMTSSWQFIPDAEDENLMKMTRTRMQTKNAFK